MTTITTDRARLEELLGEYWEIAFEESSGVAATGNKANRVLHEIRALFDVKQAEIARLKAESEERLQNCAALVAENERLRAALATTPAQPATEPEQLKTGECWPERIMKQWDAMRDLIATGDKTSLPRDWFESLAEMRLIEAPATAPAQPERKPMGQFEIEAAYQESQQHHLRPQDFNKVCDMVRAVEAFHGITGGKT